MYLLDTNVISELRRSRPAPVVLDWFARRRESDLHLSAVTFGEIQAGIEALRPRDPLKAAEIEAWLESLALSFNVLPLDGAAFRK